VVFTDYTVSEAGKFGRQGTATFCTQFHYKSLSVVSPCDQRLLHLAKLHLKYILFADVTRPVTRGEKVPQENFSPHLEKCVEHSLKLLDTVQKCWAPLRNLFAPAGVPSWLRAWM